MQLCQRKEGLVGVSIVCIRCIVFELWVMHGKEESRRMKTKVEIFGWIFSTVRRINGYLEVYFTLE